MATLSRWEPVRELASLQDEVERLFRQVFGGEGAVTSAGAFSPALDIEERDDAFVLHVELPGVSPDEVEVSLEDDVLVISGERRFYDEKSSDNFRRVERRFGRFYRAVRLPERIDADRVTATYKDGVLTVTVPKAPEARPRRVKVTAA